MPVFCGVFSLAHPCLSTEPLLSQLRTEGSPPVSWATSGKELGCLTSHNAGLLFMYLFSAPCAPPPRTQLHLKHHVQGHLCLCISERKISGFCQVPAGCHWAAGSGEGPAPFVYFLQSSFQPALATQPGGHCPEPVLGSSMRTGHLYPGLCSFGCLLSPTFKTHPCLCDRARGETVRPQQPRSRSRFASHLPKLRLVPAVGLARLCPLGFTFFMPLLSILVVSEGAWAWSSRGDWDPPLGCALPVPSLWNVLPISLPFSGSSSLSTSQHSMSPPWGRLPSSCGLAPCNPVPLSVTELGHPRPRAWPSDPCQLFPLQLHHTPESLYLFIDGLAASLWQHAGRTADCSQLLWEQG